MGAVMPSRGSRRGSGVTVNDRDGRGGGIGENN